LLAAQKQQRSQQYRGLEPDQNTRSFGCVGKELIGKCRASSDIARRKQNGDAVVVRRLTLALETFAFKAKWLACYPPLAPTSALAWQAPGYKPLILARIVTGLAHGVFCSIDSTIATSLVPKEKAASAIMFTGLTSARSMQRVQRQSLTVTAPL
jgi:hypothetical protein